MIRPTTKPVTWIESLVAGYSTVDKLLEDVLWLSFAQKDTSLCAPRLFHAVSQSIAQGDKDNCFEGASVLKALSGPRVHPAEIL